MEEKNKRYILENIHKESVGEISKKLGIKEKKVRRFLEKEKAGKQVKELISDPQNPAFNSKARKRNALVIFALLAVGGLAYSNTFTGPFHLDDSFSVTDNPAIRHIFHLGNIWHFWPTRFITYLSLAFNYHFHRLDVFGYHLFNLAVHLGSGILVWWLSLLIFSTPAMKGRKIAGQANLISFLAGLIFVAHPIQTQAVTYVVQRAASLATFFYVASLSFYVKSRLSAVSSRRRLYYGGSLVAAVLAMFTKEMTITLPLMIGLVEAGFLKTKGRFDAKRVLPFLFCLFIIPLTMLMTKSVNIGEMRRAAETAPGISSMHYLLTQFRVIVTYVRLLFLPVNQNLDYDYPVAHTLFALPILASLLFLAGIFFGAVRLFRNHRFISFGIFWFFLTLLPESSIIPIKDVIFEHRLYLPMVGFSLFLASGLCCLFEKNNFKAKIVIFTMIILSYSVLTYARNSVWKDELALWNDTVRKSSRKARPYADRGNVYLKKGDLDRAILDYDKAVKLKPDLAEAYNSRGYAYSRKGDLGQAILDYNKAIEVDPDLAGAYSNRGYAYFQKGSFNQALSDYSKAIEIKPDYADAHYNRGLFYQSKGNFDEALSDYNKAIEFEPGHADAYNNRGSVYFQQGYFDLALSDYNQAIELRPDYADAYNNRGSTWFQKGDLDQALLDFNKAIAIKPGYADALNNRELLYKNSRGKKG